MIATPLTLSWPLVAVGLDVVAGQADDALDEVVLGVLGQQADEDERVVERPTDGAAALLAEAAEPGLAARVLEDDDVAAVEVERARASAC